MQKNVLKLAGRPALVTRTKALEQLGIDLDGAAQLEREGKLSPEQVGKGRNMKVYYPKSQVDQLASSQQVHQP